MNKTRGAIGIDDPCPDQPEAILKHWISIPSQETEADVLPFSKSKQNQLAFQPVDSLLPLPRLLLLL